MRFEGTLARWNDERGYGFIVPEPGGQELFVHISAFARDGQRPRLNERLSFEVALDRQGKKQAVAVQRPLADAGRSKPATARARRAPSDRPSFGRSAALLLACALLAAGYWFHDDGRQPVPARPSPGLPAAQVSAPAPPAAATAFRCDGRKHCSQMTSCAEAKFFLRNCPDPRMDGNNDGVPCEQQWCTHPLAP